MNRCDIKLAIMAESLSSVKVLGQQGSSHGGAVGRINGFRPRRSKKNRFGHDKVSIRLSESIICGNEKLMR